MTRYVIRHRAFMTSPRAVREVLHAQRTVCSGVSRRVPDWRQDFFMFYPEGVQNADQRYREIRSFAVRTKGNQRDYLKSHGIKTPADYPAHDGKFIVRPHHHHSGIGWRVTTNASDFNPRSEYISPLFPKRHEYRVLYCRGKRIATLKKHITTEIPIDQPWNHANGSSFVTVNHEENDRLRHTSVYTDLEALNVIKYAHLTGVDVLYGRINDARAYAVLEINFSPAITIPANLEKLKEIWNSQ